MGFKISVIVGWILLLIAARLNNCQEDSLRSALNAVDRRQKDLSNEIIGDYGYSLDDPEDLSYLPDENPLERDCVTDQELERILVGYLGNDPRYDTLYDIKKKLSSPFRERLEEDKERQFGEFLQNLDENKEYFNSDNDDYDEIIRELWIKYKSTYPSFFKRQKIDMNTDMKYYPKFGLDNTGLRKRNKFLNQKTLNNPFYLYNNVKDDKNNNNNLLNDDNNEEYNSIKNYDNNKDNRRQGSLSYSTMKRFPISKRSPEISHEHKRSPSKTEQNQTVKTDPKVVKDLTKIFAPSNKKLTTSKPEKSTTEQLIKKDKDLKTKNDKSNKEQLFFTMNNKPLQIKKKSINWSDYFGLDRRKKTDNNNGLENDWMLEHYHQAVAMAKKRTLQHNLQIFKNHDLPSTDKDVSNIDVMKMNKKDNLTPEETKISEMDSKLKTMEDTIIDDALKFTGSHVDGDLDSKETQEVKDKIISRLAAAYSLEKMRRAISEYKLSIAKEKGKLLLEPQKSNKDDYEFLENKRASVPRKQAIDEDAQKIPESDNNIKCTQENEDCEEQTYRAPPDIIQLIYSDQCPNIQNVCAEFSVVVGNYGRVFETACNLHQMCLLCSNNSWFTPTRQCNALFLSKAFELCDGKQDCQKEAQRSVRYLRDVSRTLRMEPLGDCQSACPDRR